MLVQETRRRVILIDGQLVSAIEPLRDRGGRGARNSFENKSKIRLMRCNKKFVHWEHLGELEKPVEETMDTT